VLKDEKYLEIIKKLVTNISFIFCQKPQLKSSQGSGEEPRACFVYGAKSLASSLGPHRK
jgi:hypothetical protein